MRYTLLQITAFVFLATPPLARAMVEEHPNVVLIMTDDQGWGDVGSHGNPKISTPHIDKLAAASVQFERFFVSPVCAPTRASLLTGRYAARTGVTGVTGRREVMRSDETTIAEVLKGAGYRTGCFGKWHNGEQYPNHPRGQGFDDFFGFCGGHWNNYFNAQLEHNSRSIETDGYITDVITDAAQKFIGQNADRPFFCYVPYNAPHTPWQVPDEWFEKYADKDLSVATQSAYAMVENIDHNIGRLLQTLTDRGLDKSTVVIFLTDNGPNGIRYNGNMRGRKGSVHEGGVRVPLFVRWPGTLKPRTVTRIAAHVDLLPTIADLCAVPLPKTRPLDGRSLVPIMNSAEAEKTWPNRQLVTFRRTGNGQVRAAVRTQRYRFVREKQDQLYDMVIDPQQTQDLRRSNPEKFRELQTVLNQQLKSLDLSTAPVPIPIGFKGHRAVQLPGVEASLSDNVRYHNQNGWAHDWISDFDKQGDSAMWAIDVKRAGEYVVFLDYACDDAAVKASISLTAGENSITAVITQAGGKPVTRRPERVAPKGGLRLVRGFQAVNLGTISLQPGAQSLTLRHLSETSRPVEIGGLRLCRK